MVSNGPSKPQSAAGNWDTCSQSVKCAGVNVSQVSGRTSQDLKVRCGMWQHSLEGVWGAGWDETIRHHQTFRALFVCGSETLQRNSGFVRRCYATEFSRDHGSGLQRCSATDAGRIFKTSSQRTNPTRGQTGTSEWKCRDHNEIFWQKDKKLSIPFLCISANKHTHLFLHFHSPISNFCFEEIISLNCPHKWTLNMIIHKCIGSWLDCKTQIRHKWYIRRFRKN